MTEYSFIVDTQSQSLNIGNGQVLNFQAPYYVSSVDEAKNLAGSTVYPEAVLKGDVLTCGRAEQSSLAFQRMRAARLIALVQVSGRWISGCQALGCAFCSMVTKEAE
jgi:hypothetical protein